MGTFFEIFIPGDDENYSRQAAVAVFAEIDRLERILSRFDAGSDVGQLSRLKSGQSLKVGVELIECLKIAEEVRVQTNGAFDVSIGSLLRRQDNSAEPGGGGAPGLLGDWKLHDRREDSADPKQKFFRGAGGAVLQKGGGTPGPRSPLRDIYRRTDWCAGNHEIVVTGNDCVPLDFGGIGKGYALDKVRSILGDWEIEHVLIHAGTSTALGLGDAPGNPPGVKGWPVGAGGETIYLHDMALSGSGKEVKGEHILDPRSGENARGHVSAWVVHSSAAAADALSTAFIVMGPEEAERFCRDNPNIWAKLVEKSGAVRVYNPEALLLT